MSPISDKIVKNLATSREELDNDKINKQAIIFSINAYQSSHNSKAVSADDKSEPLINKGEELEIPQDEIVSDDDRAQYDGKQY